MDVSLVVNGKPCAANIDPRTLLCDFLRDGLGLTGTKIGCESGQCGSCTVLLNGSSVKSCMVLAAQAGGGNVTTIEGVSRSGHLNPVQQAFLERHAVQTGFTTPGLVMSITDLLGQNPSPSEAEIRSWLDGHLVRDTGYHNVVRAAGHAAALLRETGHPSSETAPSSAIGSSMRRREDPELLRGEGKFVADLTLPGMLHAAILYSPHAHAKILAIDTTAAAAMPGVVRVFTGDDTAHLMPLPCVWLPRADQAENHFPPHPSGAMPGAQTVLARDRVRFVGEHVALVVAETRQQAYDALPAIRVDYEILPAVVDAEEALKPGAPQLHESVPRNLCTHVIHGDKAAAEKAIAEAEVVIRQSLSVQRVIHHAEEPRGTIGAYDPQTEEFTLWTNTQIPHGNRFLITQMVFGTKYNKLRVIVPHIGGSYGSKGYLYATEPLLLFAAKLVGRPVKWIDTRWGLTRSTVHGRDQKSDVILAGTRDGKISALYCKNFGNLGAYPATNGPSPPVLLTARSVTGAYAIAHPCCEVTTAFTNTMLVGPIRGAGRTEAIFFIERMIDLYAREIGLDPAEVRRINMVKPDQFPYDNGLGWTYDSGNYVAALNRALEMVGYDDLAARKAEARRRGKRLGVGIGSYVAIAGVGPSSRMGAEGLIGSVWASCHLIVQPTGEVSVTIGAQPHGQSHVTTFSQIIATELGIPIDDIEIRHSDTRGGLFGQGSYGSRTFSVEGAVVALACRQIKQKACTLGAHLLKVPLDEVVYESGRVFRRDAAEQAKTFKDLAMAAWLAWDLPRGMEPCFDVTTYFDPTDFNFPFGSHVALVEIDEETGKVDLVRYVAVNDVGNVGNPAVVDGQMHGNIALGVGQALFEGAVYDADGQLLSADFTTYALPRATDLPDFELDRTVTPTTLNPLGAKGAGDVANPAVPPAIVNAVCDAMNDLGVKHVEMPVTSESIWRLLHPRSAKRDAGPARPAAIERLDEPGWMSAVELSYAAPDRLAEALNLLAGSRQTMILAGGHSVLPLLRRTPRGRVLLVDLRNLDELRGVSATSDGGLEIGAMTTLAELSGSDLVRTRCPALCEAALSLVDPQIRHRATIGGALASNDPRADLPAVALAVEATIQTASPGGGGRSIAATEFLAGPDKTVLAPAEVIRSVRFPAAGESAYEKFAIPATRAALCGVAVVVLRDGDSGTCRVALTGAAEQATRLHKIEAALMESRLADASAFAACAEQLGQESLSYRSDFYGSADYRAHLSRILIERALKRAWGHREPTSLSRKG